MFFKAWSALIAIIGVDGSGSIKELLLVVYLLSLGLLIIIPKIKKSFKRTRYYTKEELSHILNEKTKTIEHLRNDCCVEINSIRANVIRDQMDYAENALDTAKNDLMQSYIKFLEKKLKESKTYLDAKARTMNIQVYSFILDKIYGAVLKETLRSFKNDELEKLEDLELDIFLGKITETCLSKGEIEARKHHNEDIMYVSYDEGRSTVDPTKVFKQVNDVFKKAKRIAHKAELKIKETEEKYAEERDEILNNID